MSDDEKLSLKQLRYFVAVAELGSFSRAAVTLSVAQPVLSRVIKALETDLEIELLYRNGRGIVLTDAGKMLEGYAKSILDTAARAQNEVMALGDTPTGRVVIGVPPSVGRVLTLPLVKQFRISFPKVVLKVIEAHSGHVLEWLATGKIDVAVLYSAPKSTTMVTEPLVEEDLYLVGSGDHPSAPKTEGVPVRDLGRYSLIVPGLPHGLRLLVNHVCEQAGVDLSVEYEIDAMPAVLDLVEEGVGFTILPYAPVHKLVSAGRLQIWPIVDPHIRRELLLVTSTQRPMTLATRHLARMVRKQVKELVHEGRWMPVV